MKIQAPIGYFPITDRSVGYLEGLSPSGRLALQKLAELANQGKEKVETGAQPALPPLTVGTYIDIRV